MYVDVHTYMANIVHYFPTHGAWNARWIRIENAIMVKDMWTEYLNYALQVQL